MRSPVPYPLAALRPALLVLGVLVSGVSAARAQTTPPATTPETTTAPVRLAPLPDDARFDQTVNLRTRPAGESLDALIQILARSVGLSAITQGIPTEALGRYNLNEPKPFREVWEIVLTLNGLEYVLRDDDIIVVGPPAALAGLTPARREGPPLVTRTYPVSSDAEQLQELLESQFPLGSDVTVSSFPELGLLSVLATEVEQAQVESVLTQFDRTAATPVRRAYRLSYARADELAEVLTASVTAPENEGGPSLSTAQQPTQQGAGNAVRQALTDTLTAPAATQTATGTAAGATGESAALVDAGQFSIAADPRSNRIIVTAPANVQRDIAALIAELDQPERQVNVQVRIQEVSSTVTERLGVDLTSAFGNFSTRTFAADDSGLSFIFDAQQAVTSFNLGAVLDVYENQQLARRVDDSNLTVRNNGEARIQSGGTLYINIAGAGSLENIERTIEYGVQIEVTPQITTNNEVSLDINGRVDTPLEPVDNPALLNVQTRNLTSRVTVAPNQTVVLGGLLENVINDGTASIPLLGDVPVLGSLFSTSTLTDTSTELLIIVTANVIE